VTIWTEHGNTISNKLGQAIETGGEISVELYPEVIGSQTHLPGSYMPEYTLQPPGNLKIAGNPTTVKAETPMSALVKPGMGNVKWAACCVVRQPQVRIIWSSSDHF
jgi:hypothetical protein